MTGARGRRKLLLLAPFPPHRHGLHGGAQVLGRFTEEICSTHSVRVLYFRAPQEPDMERALTDACESVEQVYRSSTGTSPLRWARLFSAWLAGKPMWVSEWEREAFRQRARTIILEWRPDIVQAEFHIMGQYWNTFAGTPSVLVVHEPGTAAAEDRWRHSHGWRRIVYRRDVRAWAEYESRVLPRFDAVVCFTERDRLALQAISPTSRLTVISPCGPLKQPLCPHGQSPPRILFVGNYGHAPNIEAAMRLAGSILPLVRAKHAGARLELVGDGPPASIRTLASESVLVTGKVDDLHPYLDAADVVALPLRSGGGVRVKTMEALASRKAVVASKLAVEGLNVVAHRDYLPAETDAEFAEAIGRLLADPERRREIANNARAWAETYDRAGRMTRAFESLYAQLQRTTVLPSA